MQVSQQHRFCLGVLVLSLGVLAQESEAFAAEVTEIIGVVRLGVSVVEYMYKVFAQIAQDPAVQDLDVLGRTCFVTSLTFGARLTDLVFKERETVTRIRSSWISII